MSKMCINRLYLIIFVLAIISPVEKSCARGTSESQEDNEPCDTCPRKGKCVPKVSCPAHVRPGSSNPECHLESGQIGVCCFTGRKHAAESDRKKSRSSKKKDSNTKKKAHNASKSKMRLWKERTENILENCNNTVVSVDSPEYGHQLSMATSDNNTKELGEGGLLNLFAAEDLKERQAIDDDDLSMEYGEAYDGPFCPPQPTCPDPPSPYRSINGECTNPHHPTWGAANTGYERLLPPDYGDGIWSFRTSQCGTLPGARAVSSNMVLDGHYPSDTNNIMFSQFSQFVAHDVSQAVVFNYDNGSFISCCSKDGGPLAPELLHFACAPISVDPDDDFFSYFSKTCLNFVRAQLAPSPDCTCGYAKQMNGVTHLIDLSQLYGKTIEKLYSLRASGGYLKVVNSFGRDLPPLTDRPECLAAQGSACFDSGDNHGNQLITLTVLHTIYTREHNRMVKHLSRLNPDWDDDTMFYNVRRILQAMHQHIVWNEWLPLVIGPELMEIHKLASGDGYSTSYDCEVNPSVVVEFAGAAMRFGHSTMDGKLKVTYPKTGEPSEVIAVAELMQQPSRLLMRPFLDRMIHGMVTQPMQAVDPFITQGLTRYMFRGTGAHGLDLAAINLQRGRDLGLRPYNHYLKLCGLDVYESFDKFSASARDRLCSVYDCPEDVDLWIGGLLEKAVEGGCVGSTLACIIAEQFTRFKNGDRYFYDHGRDVNPGAFTPSQLQEIKKISLARILCNNLDYIELTSMSPNAFLRSDLPGNAPVQCGDTDTIPSMDLSRFKDM